MKYRITVEALAISVATGIPRERGRGGGGLGDGDGLGGGGGGGGAGVGVGLIYGCFTALLRRKAPTLSPKKGALLCSRKWRWDVSPEHVVIYLGDFLLYTSGMLSHYSRI